MRARCIPMSCVAVLSGCVRGERCFPLDEQQSKHAKVEAGANLHAHHHHWLIQHTHRLPLRIHVVHPLVMRSRHLLWLTLLAHRASAAWPFDLLRRPLEKEGLVNLGGLGVGDPGGWDVGKLMAFGDWNGDQ